jgi:hypothetical protein
MEQPLVTSIMLVLRLGIGVILFRLALNPRYRNLHWLAAVFYLNFVNLFLRGPAFGPVSQVVMIVIQICLALFTHTTFYQDRRSPVAWVIAGLVAAGGASLYLTPRVPTYPGLQPMPMMCALNWFWHALVAWQVWHRLRSDRSIEDWIKTRYVLVVTYAVVMGALFLLPVWRSSVPLVRAAWWVAMMLALVLQYLAWGMPAAMRRYLNRNYRPPVADEQALSMTEDDVLRALEKQAH